MNLLRDLESASTSTNRTPRLPPGEDVIRSEFESLLSESSSDEETSDPNNIVKQQATKRNENRETTSTTKSPTTTTNKSPANEAVSVDRSEDVDEIILSLIWNNNHLGAAYYDIATSELFVMQDTHDDVDRFNLTRVLYRQCRPHYVVTITGTATAFLNAVKKLVITETLNGERNSFASRASAHGVVLRMMSKKDHNFERCLHRVRCLRLTNEPENASNADRITFLNSILNFKCQAMIHALGSLLLFIDKHWNNIALDPSGRATFISLKYMTLQDLVMVDDDTYEALNIVNLKHHPSLFKFGATGTRMQGICLYSLMNRCKSKPGVQYLWKSLQHPTRNINVLNKRLDTIEFFLEPSNQSMVENLLSCLHHVYRLTKVIYDCCTGPQAKASDWYKLHKTVAHVIYIADICETQANKNELFKKIAESVTTEMQYVKYFIEYIVDFGASRREKKLVVKSNVDPLLDELNHVRSTLPQLLTQMGEKDMQEHLPIFVSGCNMLYLPNIGYVLAINAWNPTPPEDMILPGLEFKFTINGVHYYKSPSARELDETIGDIMLKITARQTRILLKLIRYINKHAAPILDAIHLCAELDTYVYPLPKLSLDMHDLRLLAFYSIARDHNYVRPKLVESQIIAVKEGRHPLHECSTTFVPNDIYSGDGKSLVKVLTGPNTCGKSVYLKQIGLITFMAHIGSYVPAKSATIGVVSHIFTQIINTESSGLNASSFLQDLRQINAAVSGSTRNSLVIMDEFGRGTSEASGIALLGAVLNTFLERGPDCPHVFAATHIHSVLTLIPQTPLVESQTFEYVSNDDESLAFLYRLTSGNTTRSFAHFIAKTAELDGDVVKRSLEVYEKMKQGILPAPIKRSDMATAIIERLTVPQTDLEMEDLISRIREVIETQVKSEH